MLTLLRVMQSEKSFERNVFEMTHSFFSVSILASFTQAGSKYGGAGCCCCSIVNRNDTWIVIVPLYRLAV